MSRLTMWILILAIVLFGVAVITMSEIIQNAQAAGIGQ